MGQMQRYALPAHPDVLRLATLHRVLGASSVLMGNINPMLHAQFASSAASANKVQAIIEPVWIANQGNTTMDTVATVQIVMQANTQA
jgi:hypothetical protein